eukprot:1079247-Pyramimonas_sp.AAC.1
MPKVNAGPLVKNPAAALERSLHDVWAAQLRPIGATRNLNLSSEVSRASPGRPRSAAGKY